MAANQSVSYFARFPNFEADHIQSITVNFNRLAVDRGWRLHGGRYRREHALLMEQEFDHQMHDVINTRVVGPWQALLRELGVGEGEIPTSIKQCKLVC